MQFHSAPLLGLVNYDRLPSSKKEHPTKDRMLNQAIVHLQVSVLAFLGV